MNVVVNFVLDVPIILHLKQQSVTTKGDLSKLN
jgi:hypothetical protein